MSNSLNQCQFIGNLGRDPETRYLPSGESVCNFSIGVGWKTKDKEGTEWVNVTAFSKLAEICGQYLKKGSHVFIQGRMQTRKWQDKEGNDRYTTEIIADKMQMLGGRPESAPETRTERAAPTRTAAPRQAPAPAYATDDLDSDIPF